MSINAEPLKAWQFEKTDSAVTHIRRAGGDLALAGQGLIMLPLAAFGPVGFITASAGGAMGVFGIASAGMETGRAVAAVAMGHITTPAEDSSDPKNTSLTQAFTEAMETPLTDKEENLATYYAAHGNPSDKQKAIPAIALGRYLNEIEKNRRLRQGEPMTTPDLTYKQILADTEAHFTTEEATRTYLAMMKGRNMTIPFDTDDVGERVGQRFNSSKSEFNKTAFNPNLKISEVAALPEDDYQKFRMAAFGNMNTDIGNLNAYMKGMLHSQDTSRAAEINKIMGPGS